MKKKTFVWLVWVVSTMAKDISKTLQETHSQTRNGLSLKRQRQSLGRKSELVFKAFDSPQTLSNLNLTVEKFTVLTESLRKTSLIMFSLQIVRTILSFGIFKMKLSTK